MKKIFAELFEQFVKSNKREPKGLELVKMKLKAGELQREADKIIEFPRNKIQPLDPDDALPNYKETPGEYSRRNTPGSIENLREEMKIAYRNEFDRLTGNETAEELTDMLKNLDTDGVPFAKGGQAKPKDVSLSDFLKVKGSGSISGKQDMYSTGEKSAIKLPEGVTSDESFINLIANLDIPISEKISLLGDVQYNKFRNKIQKGDEELFLEDPASSIDRKIGIGVDSGTGITGSAKYGIDDKGFLFEIKKSFAEGGRTSVAGGGLLKKVLKDYQKYLKTRKERPSKKRFKEIPFRKFFEIYGPENFADGGQATSTGLNYLLGEDDTNSRVPYAGGGMGRRGFLKLLAGLGAAGAAFKTGLMSLKGAAKPVAKVAAETATSTAPPHFLKLVAKIKALGDDVTETAALAERQNVKKYKDFELTEDIATGKQEIIRYKQSDEATYYGQPLTEETYMSYTPGETIIGKGNKPVKTLDDYEEGTSFIRNDRGYTGEVVDESNTIADDILEEVEAGSGNVPESFYTGPNPIKKADGGRIGYAGGKKVVEGLISLLNKKAGKDVLTTADKIAIPKKTLDRDMFKNFETKYPETSAADATLNIPVQQEGKFTKAEYLIQRLENTIKESPNDKYVQDTFPGFINELKTNPELAKNENVFKELGGDLPEGQQIVVYGDDTLDFFTQKSGPGNIDKLKKLMAKHNISREKALKIMKMEPNDQVMELKMLEVANRKLNAEGGRIGLLAGGGVLKKLIMNLAKEKGMSGSEVLKVMNYKSLPSKIKNLMTKEEFTSMKDQRLEGVEIWRDLMSSQQEMTRNIDAGKNTPAAELFEMLEKTSPGYGTVPRNISDADMLQMEQMIKNMKTKDNRQLNATGGLANLLGE